MKIPMPVFKVRLFRAFTASSIELEVEATNKTEAENIAGLQMPGWRVMRVIMIR